METKVLIGVLAVIAVIGLLGLSEANAFSLVSVSRNEGTITQNPRTITVTGIAQYSETPDVVYVYLTVETIADTAEEAGNQNADKMESVRYAMYKLGIDKDEIESSNYYLSPMRKWVNGTYVTYSYRATHTLKIEYSDIENVGEIIDDALEAGANRVDNIQFDLTEETRQELKNKALKDAAINARDKADAIADGLNVHIVGVYSATESSVSYNPYRYYGYEMAVGAAESADTEISPEDVSFSASLTVSFEIA